MIMGILHLKWTVEIVFNVFYYCVIYVIQSKINYQQHY